MPRSYFGSVMAVCSSALASPEDCTIKILVFGRLTYIKRFRLWERPPFRTCIMGTWRLAPELTYEGFRD